MAKTPEEILSNWKLEANAKKLLEDAKLFVKQYGIGSDSRNLATASFIIRALAPATPAPIAATNADIELIAKSHQNRVARDAAKELGVDVDEMLKRAPIAATWGQSDRDARLIEGLENHEIIYYGPQSCDLCGKNSIARGSDKQGFGDLRFEYPRDIIYPNHNWTLHVCASPREEKQNGS